MTIGSWVSLGDAALTKQAPAATGLNAPAGSSLPYSSRFSAHFSVDQEIPITLGTSGVVGASVNYVGEREGNFQPTAARAIFPAYAELDVLAGVKHDSWRINLSVDNATDRRGVIGGGLDAGLPPYPLLYIRPRTVELSVSKTF